MFVAVLAHQSAKVLLLGGNDERLQIGKPTVRPLIPSVGGHTSRSQRALWGQDVVIEATGVPAVWETAIACVQVQQSTCSEVVLGTSITVNTEQLHHSELTPKGVSQHPEFVRRRHC